MKVKVNGRTVDVLDRACPKKPCFWLGFDKGILIPGQGYRYHTDGRGKPVEYAVCWRRHRFGCPASSECFAQKGGEV